MSQITSEITGQPNGQLSGHINTDFTKLMNCRWPIIGAPMFLVSNVDMVVKISESGGVGTFPALNYRPIEEYKSALSKIKSQTKKPIGVNIIVNKSNTRQNEDLRHALEAGVELFITSLGSPRQIILDAHKNGAKVFCDVVNLEQAQKVQDLGADGVIAVGTGAGGHAGPISPLVLIPWLKKKIRIPIIAAGGIADGYSMAAALTLGASAVSVGTRFIASHEAQIDKAYKDAVLRSSPEDIVMSTRISGTPAAVINTPYVKKTGLHLPWYLKLLKDNPMAKKFAVPLIHWMGMKKLEEAARGPTWKTVWSAGQSVGLIDEILSCEEIIDKLVREYHIAQSECPKLEL
jgi:nitronate monooxygenase